jgi:ArsR family transcriptional regulator, virulence genes transcriptional regulator
MAATKKIPYDKKRCARAATIFKTLSHPQRLQIFCCLCEKDRTVSDLQQECAIRQAVISQHLSRMRLEGLVLARRSGNFVSYRVADPRLLKLIETMQRITHD